MKKLIVLVAVLALASLSLAACGDDDDDDGGDEPATTQEAPTEGGGEAGGATTLQLGADPGGDLAFDTDTLEAQAGDLTIEFDNPADLPHDVCLEGPGGEDLGCSETVTGDSTSLMATVEAGDYTFYCSVTGHREAGMEGTLTAE